MKLFIEQADIVVRVNPFNARIWAIGRPRPEHRRALPRVQRLVILPNETGWQGDAVVGDYATLVALENWLRKERPQWRHSTIRRHLRSMVHGAWLNDQLRIRDAADDMQVALPWVGECSWLMRECYRSACIGPFAVRLEQMAAGALT